MKATLTLAAFIATVCLVGCMTHSRAPQQADVYDSPTQVLAMSSCRARVDEIAPCYARLRTEDGKVLSIGSPAASPEIVGFVHTLRKGKTYHLPDAFAEYQRK